MKVLAVILARGGKQHVARKNIVPILGRPSLLYSIDHVREAHRVSDFLVSTEDEEIADIARKDGVNVLDRPAHLSLPDTRLDHVLRHVVDERQRAGLTIPDVLAMIYGAVPIRPRGFIDRCLETLETTNADSVRSLSAAGEHHPLWSVKLTSERRIQEFVAGNVYRRQELPPAYYYSGACVVLRTDCLLRATADATNNFSYLGTDQRGEVHLPHECVEIHEEIDIAWAEFLLQRQRN